jgi:hypothetical protein
MVQPIGSGIRYLIERIKLLIADVMKVMKNQLDAATGSRPRLRIAFRCTGVAPNA